MGRFEPCGQVFQAEKRGLAPANFVLTTETIGKGSRVDCIARTGVGQGVSYHVMKPWNGRAERKSAGRAKITFYSNRCCGMRTIHSILRSVSMRCSSVGSVRLRARTRHFFLFISVGLFLLGWSRAQDDPLNKVHVPPPSSTTPGAPATGAPAGAEPTAATGTKRSPGCAAHQ